jgi:hypothetical protein
MAKRRNLKKEKAERNQMYARQFRKKNAQNFSRGRRSGGFNGGGFNGGKKQDSAEDSPD